MTKPDQRIVQQRKEGLPLTRGASDRGRLEFESRSTTSRLRSDEVDLIETPHVGLYDRIFAFGYDRGLQAAERGGLAERRHQLLAQAHGRVLEIGAGTGLNLTHYTDAVEQLVLTEPSEPMARRLRERTVRLRPDANVVIAPGEQLPFDDSSFDYVVTTLVLCTVPDAAASLAETRRVLAPGGRLLFLEHVRWDDPKRAKWQDRLERPWERFGNGCHCNRDTGSAIEAAGFALESIDHGEMPHAPPLVRPLIEGVAVKSV